jgi:hypothetical protein
MIRINMMTEQIRRTLYQRRSKERPNTRENFNAYMREYRKRPAQLVKETARKADWIARNPDKHRAAGKRAARKRRLVLIANPELQRAISVKYNHALSLEEYDNKLAQQNNLCRLCNRPFTEDDGPVLDHDHETHQLRDFIHRNCNLAIGNLKDSPERCRLAAEYLERHAATAVVP